MRLSLTKKGSLVKKGSHDNPSNKHCLAKMKIHICYIHYVVWHFPFSPELRLSWSSVYHVTSYACHSARRNDKELAVLFDILFSFVLFVGSAGGAEPFK